MVAKNGILTAAERIDEKLQKFVMQRAEAKVLVSTNQLGHLFAVVATHAFEGIAEDERVRQVWDFLRSELPPEDLGFLYRIHAFTATEYDARRTSALFQGDHAELLDLGENPEELSQ